MRIAFNQEVVAQAPIRPSLFQVMLHNDDWTPTGFVVDTLRDVFKLTKERATETMLSAHNTGSAPVAVLPADIARDKIDQAINLARHEMHPLSFSIKPVPSRPT